MEGNKADKGCVCERVSTLGNRDWLPPGGLWETVSTCQRPEGSFVLLFCEQERGRMVEGHERGKLGRGGVRQKRTKGRRAPVGTDTLEPLPSPTSVLGSP